LPRELNALLTVPVCAPHQAQAHPILSSTCNCSLAEQMVVGPSCHAARLQVPQGFRTSVSSSALQQPCACKTLRTSAIDSMAGVPVTAGAGPESGEKPSTLHRRQMTCQGSCDYAAAERHDQQQSQLGWLFAEPTGTGEDMMRTLFSGQQYRAGQFLYVVMAGWVSVCRIEYVKSYAQRSRGIVQSSSRHRAGLQARPVVSSREASFESPAACRPQPYSSPADFFLVLFK
jgi:hypothetical protein